MRTGPCQKYKSQSVKPEIIYLIRNQIAAGCPQGGGVGL